MCLDIKICKCLASNQANTNNFHPLEVVGRADETQLQVNENGIRIISQLVNG